MKFKAKVFSVNTTPELVISGEIYPHLDNLKRKCGISKINYEFNSELSEEDKVQFLKGIESVIIREGVEYYYNITKDNAFSKCPFKNKEIEIKLTQEGNDIIVKVGSKSEKFYDYLEKEWIA